MKYTVIFSTGAGTRKSIFDDIGEVRAFVADRISKMRSMLESGSPSDFVLLCEGVNPKWDAYDENTYIFGFYSYSYLKELVCFKNICDFLDYTKEDLENILYDMKKRALFKLNKNFNSQDRVILSGTDKQSLQNLLDYENYLYRFITPITEKYLKKFGYSVADFKVPNATSENLQTARREFYQIVR